MYIAILKVVAAASIISFVSWLSGKKPELAGFITALPIMTMIALAFSHGEHQDLSTVTTYARSVAVAVPMTMTFFIPFFFADKIGLSFWPTYILAFICLSIGYFAHGYIMKLLG